MSTRKHQKALLPYCNIYQVNKKQQNLFIKTKEKQTNLSTTTTR